MSEKPIGVFLANHLEDTCYRWWSLDRWKQEIANAKAIGSNTVWYLPIQFGERQPHEFTDESAHWQLQKEISAAIADAGLKVGMYCGINDTFAAVADEHPDWQATLGRYMEWPGQLCPSIPEARAEILRIRERIFATLPQIDFLLSPPTDLGGCSCDRCDPWPKTYLDLFEEQAELLRRYHPNASIVAAAHGMRNEETEMLRSVIRECDWIDYVADNPRGAGKPYIKYYMGPEITMLSGWGKYGAAPYLSRIADYYHLDAKSMGGAVVYSEGIHDDVNRYASIKLAQNANQSAFDLAQSYSKDWLGLSDADVDLMAGIILGLENPVGHQLAFHSYMEPNYGAPNPDADTRLLQLIRLRDRCPHLVENYRYWLLHYRSVCECMSISTGYVPTETIVSETKLAQRRLCELEPGYGNFLQSLSVIIRAGEIPLNWPRTFHETWRRERELGEVDAPKQ